VRDEWVAVLEILALIVLMLFLWWVVQTRQPKGPKDQ
jgi:hypothetical protein